MKVKRLTRRVIDGLQPGDRPIEVYAEVTPGLIYRLEPSGKASWYVWFRNESGKQKRVRIGSATEVGPEQAADAAARLRAQVREGRDPGAEKQAKRKTPEIPTLRAFTEPGGELDRHLEQRHRKNTKAVHRVRVAFDSLLDIPLPQITVARVTSWESRKAASGMAQSSLNVTIACLRGILRRAVEWGIIEVNPLATYKMGRVTEQKRQPRAFTADEMDRIFQALEARDVRMKTRLGVDPAARYADHVMPMVTVLASTGCRVGEISALRWSDLDMNSGTLTVRAEVAKSRRARVVPLNRAALECLRAWRDQTGGIGFVFHREDGSPIKRSWKAWGNVLRAAHVPHAGIHTLRHTFASRLIQCGVDVETLRSLLGHSAIATTAIYLHANDTARSRAVALLDTPSASQSRPQGEHGSR